MWLPHHGLTTKCAHRNTVTSYYTHSRLENTQTINPQNAFELQTHVHTTHGNLPWSLSVCNWIGDPWRLSHRAMGNLLRMAVVNYTGLRPAAICDVQASSAGAMFDSRGLLKTLSIIPESPPPPPLPHLCLSSAGVSSTSSGGKYVPYWFLAFWLTNMLDELIALTSMGIVIERANMSAPVHTTDLCLPCMHIGTHTHTHTHTHSYLSHSNSPNKFLLRDFLKFLQLMCVCVCVCFVAVV